MGANRRIVQQRKDGNWEVRAARAEKASAIEKSQSDAIDRARAILGNDGGGELTTKAAMARSVIPILYRLATIQIRPLIANRVPADTRTAALAIDTAVEEAGCTGVAAKSNVHRTITAKTTNQAPGDPDRPCPGTAVVRVAVEIGTATGSWAGEFREWAPGTSHRVAAVGQAGAYGRPDLAFDWCLREKILDRY